MKRDNLVTAVVGVLVRPQDVIAWFDERSSVSGGDAVVEYLRALVATDRIADFLPRSRKGDSLSLSSLVSESR